MEWMTTLDQPGKCYLMQGNEALVRGALEAGIHFAASYPGSPSSQVLGMLGKIADEFGFYAEWSTNETVAFEACLGASFAGSRALCIVKQNGLLVIEDALHCGALAGLRGGLVLISSDDPSAHSSTNEFDSRHTAVSADIPMLEPTTIQDAKDMIPYAFELSEKLGQVVLIRVTTRVCHGRGGVVLGELPREKKPFKTIGKWDRMVGINWLHETLLRKLDTARELFEDNEFNHYDGPLMPEALIITGGTGRLYSMEAIESLGLGGKVGLLTLGTLWPLPEKLICKHLSGTRRVLVVEEVDPFLENQIAAIAGKNQILVDIKGRGEVLPRIGELDPDSITRALAEYMGVSADTHEEKALDVTIPDRELTFCAGCPHRATYYVIKQALAMDPRPAAVIGDIGCYTMGGQRAGQYGYHFMGCMGSGIGAAEGLSQLTAYGFDQPIVALCGDSTFFHTIIPGLVNAKVNNANMLFIVLDNSATAMTGFQPHPGTGQTAMGKATDPISIRTVVEALGCSVTSADPFDIDATRNTIHELINQPGLKVLIMVQPCATLASKTRASKKVWVDQDICRGDSCGCGRYCSRVWGCPGNSWDFEKGKAVIDPVLCVGCGVCASICPAGAIKIEGGEDK